MRTLLLHLVYFHHFRKMPWGYIYPSALFGAMLSVRLGGL